MFTGIIQKLSFVEKVAQKNSSLFVWIKNPSGWKLKNGMSIAINGICSTVKNTGKNNFEVEYMPETIKKTTAGEFKKGTALNLERSLKLTDLVDGHIVQGHIDTVGKIIDIKKEGDSKIIKLQIPQKFARHIAPKGSITLDGISLTVVDAKKNWFTVSLVSYTLKNTNLGKIKINEEVNIETDVLAKYVEQILKSMK